MNKFKKFVESKSPKSLNNKELQQMALFGLAGEVGELIDIFKKYYYYEKPLDLSHVDEECGDILHYLVMFLNTIHSDIPTAVRSNMEKLNKRYPAGFTKARARVRLDKIKVHKK